MRINIDFNKLSVNTGEDGVVNDIANGLSYSNAVEDEMANVSCCFLCSGIRAMMRPFFHLSHL